MPGSGIPGLAGTPTGALRTEIVSSPPVASMALEDTPIRRLGTAASKEICLARLTIHPRLIKGTCGSAKRKQVRADECGAALHITKDPMQCCFQFHPAGKVPVVCAVLARVLP